MRLEKFLKKYRIETLVKDEVEYRQVTISQHTGVKYRGSKLGIKIGRKRQFIVDLEKYPNTVMFTRQGLKEGSIGFAPKEVHNCIVTENMPTLSVNTDIIDMQFLERLLNSNYFLRKISELSIVGSAQKSIHERDLLKLDIDIPDLETQKLIANKIISKESNYFSLLNEIQSQKKHLSNLKQSILQEAIQGKLTADWRTLNPNTESASELLKRIKAEKSRLIKDKKIKKEKALTPITAVDIPFELPEGWVWSRIGEITLSIQTGLEKSRQFQDESYSHMYFKMNNIDNYSGLEDYSKITRINPSEDEINDYTLEKGDFLFNTRNSRELVGKTCIFSNVLNNPVLFNNNIARLKFLNISSQFINWWFTSSACRKILFEINSSTTNVAAVYLKQLVQMLVPIAPYEEQLVINSKLNEISLKIQLLEQEIKINEANAQILMQAVLKEAFESKKEEVII